MRFRSQLKYIILNDINVDVKDKGEREIIKGKDLRKIDFKDSVIIKNKNWRVGELRKKEGGSGGQKQSKSEISNMKEERGLKGEVKWQEE